MIEIDRDHPPSDEAYGWHKPYNWEEWADLAEHLPLDQLAEKIAIFQADVSHIEYGSTMAYYEWSDGQFLAHLRRVFARRLASRKFCRTSPRS